MPWATLDELKNTADVSDISDDILTQHLNDAQGIIVEDNIPDDKLSFLHRLYTLHLLSNNGFLKVTSSESVADVRVAFEKSGTADENETPWSSQYKKELTKIKGFGKRITNQ
jgi:hypothetical protein